jgi:hypothetical protein
MLELIIYALIALVIFLLIDRRSAMTDEYWKGYEDGCTSTEIIHAMLKMKEEQNDETTKIEQQ